MLEQFMDGLLPILTIISIFAVPPIAIAFVLLKFNASKRTERMALINQGIIPQDAERKRTPNRLRTLRTALGAIGAGIGVVIGIILNNYAFTGLSDMEMFAVLLGSIFLFFGIGYVIYFIISKDRIDAEGLDDLE